MRKIVLIVVLLCSSLFLSSQPVVINMDTLTANPGDSVTIPVYAENLTNAGSFTFYITYNAGLLSWGRAMNWNPALLPGVHLANAYGGQVAVVWADNNGVNITQGKLFDLRFKYNNGSIPLNFTSQCEITDLSGVPFSGVQYSSGYVTRRISVLLHADPTALCLGDSTQLTFVVLGGIGPYTFSWSSEPEGFNDTLENPVVVPGNSTIYQVMVTDGMDTAYSTQLVTVYFYVTPTPVENMIPADGATNLTLPVLFTWTPSANASSYDLFVWKDGDPEPAIPLATGITQINYLLQTFLQYGNTYHWKIVAKNPCLETAGPIQTFTVRDLPDLVVTGINTPPQVYSGQTINVEYQIKNIGLGSTLTASWIDAAYLSTDTTLETDIDHFIGTYQNLTYLEPQQAYTKTITFTLPQGISGYYHIIIKTDHNNNVLETIENNNVNHNRDTMLVYLSPVPDLRVAKIIVQNSSFSGQHINLTWHVKNFGLANTGYRTWNDRVYFSQDSLLNSSAVNLGTFSHSGDLAVDSLYEMTRSVAIPNYILGRYYFYVVTDIYNQVYEHALENNNTLKSDSITIFLTPPPDLVATSVIAPLTASNSQKVLIQWSVQNQGVNPTTGSWHDRIYLTNSLTLNTGTAFLLGDKYHNELLEPDSLYNASLLVEIPKNITGPYYFFVYADATLRLFEHTQEENNIKRCTHSTEILPADLTSTTVTTPDSAWSGRSCQLSYYSANHGAGSLIGSWTDRIFIANSNIFVEATSVFITNSIYNSQDIPSNDSVLRNLTITMPDGISGLYYIFIVSDYNNTLFEPSHEDNNISVSIPVDIQLTPWPDLVITSIIYPDTVTPGFPFNLTYTVKNTGPGPLIYSSWKEGISLCGTYSSLSQIYYSFAQKDSITLLPDSSFSRTLSVKLPPSIPSRNYWWWINTDFENDVYEHTGESNNKSPGLQQHVLPYPPVDMVAFNVNYPTNAMSGSTIQVNWSAVNNGSVPTSNNHWWDNLYLSQDTTPDPDTDIYLNEFLYNAGIVNPGSSYNKSDYVFIPNGLSGNYYPYVYVDKRNYNYDANPANNIDMMRDGSGIPVPLNITLTPPPDLTVTSYNCPSVGIVGQPLTVSWTIKNQGIGQANGSWYDAVYLSTDFNVDNSDYTLGSYPHNGGLKVDSSYSDTVTFYIPNWTVGNYIIIVKADATNLVFEMTNENNNTASQVIDLQVPPPSDLIIPQIIPPTEAVSGQNLSLTWTLKNIGVNPAIGYMKDMIYFSLDTIWDINDILFGEMTGYISIGPNAEFNRTYEGMLTGLTPGDWYVIVRTDVLNNIVEGDDNNNTSYSVQQITVTVPQLPINIWVNNQLHNYIPLFYRIVVPSDLIGETMQIRLLGDSISGSNEMYVSYGILPSRTTYDYVYGNANEGNQDILIPFLNEGTYYLMVYGSTSSGNIQSIQLHARILNFQILSVDDNKGGNTGSVTLKLTGSKFSSAMQVHLAKGENKISGTDYQFIDATKAYATFNLDGADLGMYNVIATKFCEGITTLENGFEIVQGSNPDLQINTYQPSSVRPNGIVTVVIEFYNNGNIDLLAPEIEFISLDNAPVSLTFEGLSAGLTSLVIPLRENEGPPLVLRPGIGGTITVYAKASKGLAFLIRLPDYE